MMSTRLSTRVWELAKATFRAYVQRDIDVTGEDPGGWRRRMLWQEAYARARAVVLGAPRQFEVPRVPQGPPPTAPDEAQRLAEGSDVIPEPARDLIPLPAPNIDVERLAAQVGAVESPRAARRD